MILIAAKLSDPYQDRVDVAKSLFGILTADMILEEAREERLNTIIAYGRCEGVAYV